MDNWFRGMRHRVSCEGNLLVLNQNVSEAVSKRMIFITDGKGSRTGMARPPHFEFNFRLPELDLIDAHVDKAITAKWRST